MYIYLTSTASDDYFSNNSVTNFRVKLPKALKLAPFGHYAVALVDIDLPKLRQNYTSKHISIYSSICQPSITDSGLKPILHRVFYSYLRSGRPLSLDPLRYVPLNTDSLDVLDMYLLDDTNVPPSFRPGQLSCTLHIKSIEGSQ